MDLNRALTTTQESIKASSLFPYRTGFLLNNFFDKGVLALSDNSIGFSVLSNPKVYYGKILENAPSIRYKIRKVTKGYYSYIKHTNRHFRYIERIIEKDVVPAIERELGVVRV